MYFILFIFCCSANSRSNSQSPITLIFIFYFVHLAGKWKPNDYPFVDNVRAIYLTLEKLIQPEETQVNGIVILADYTGVGMSQASNPGPFLAKKVVSILQVRAVVCG